MEKLIQLPPSDIKIKGYAFLLLSFFFLSYILPLGIRDLAVPDETRYGEIPREMISEGDWVVPHLNGLRYFEKPVLGYWVNAGSLMLFGESNFAVRLPSAMAVGLSALLIYALVTLACRNKTKEKTDGLPAILAPLIYLSCFGVFGVGNTAVLDNLFSFFLTGTITAFYFASEMQPRSAREQCFLVLSGVLCGLAFLTKGFLAFAVPVLVLTPYLVWQRRYDDIIRMSCLPILSTVLVVLPWGIQIHLREPDFWRFFFWNEHIRRFMGDNAQHYRSFWFFFLISPGLFMPWSFLMPAAVPGIKQRLDEKGPLCRLMRLSLCWFLLPFLFFSFSNGKLLTYILPCFPPFAVLTAFGLSHTLGKERNNRLFQWGLIGNMMFLGIILLALMYAHFIGFNGAHLYYQPWKAVIAATGLLFLIMSSYWSYRSQRGKDKLLLLGISPLLFFFIGHFIIPDQTAETKSPGPLLEYYKKGIGDDVVIISDENSVRAVCWYLKRKDVYVLGKPGELSYGLSYKDAGGRLLDCRSAVDLINQNQGKTVLFARAKNILRWRDQLPRPVYQDQNGPSGYVFQRY